MCHYLNQAGNTNQGKRSPYAAQGLPTLTGCFASAISSKHPYQGIRLLPYFHIAMNTQLMVRGTGEGYGYLFLHFTLLNTRFQVPMEE